jgi:PPOX class probable F420-dependent enzyme
MAPTTSASATCLSAVNRDSVSFIPEKVGRARIAEKEARATLKRLSRPPRGRAIVLPGPDPFGSTTMAAIPDEFLDLVKDKKAFANLATLMPDGTPQVTPVWFDYVNGVLRVNTAKGRVKARNMKTGAPVAISIMDPDNAYRYLQVRGRVKRMTEQGADAHIDSLAKKYLGQDKYPYRQPGEVRQMFEIEPTHTSVMG